MKKSLIVIVSLAAMAFTGCSSLNMERISAMNGGAGTLFALRFGPDANASSLSSRNRVEMVDVYGKRHSMSFRDVNDSFAGN